MFRTAATAALVCVLGFATAGAARAQAEVPAPGTAERMFVETRAVLRSVVLRSSDGAVQSYNLGGEPCAPTLSQVWSDGTASDPFPLPLRGASVRHFADQDGGHTVEFMRAGDEPFTFSVGSPGLGQHVVLGLGGLISRCSRFAQQPGDAPPALRAENAFADLKDQLEAVRGSSGGLGVRYELRGRPCEMQWIEFMTQPGQSEVQKFVSPIVRWRVDVARGIFLRSPGVSVTVGGTAQPALWMDTEDRAVHVVDLMLNLGRACRQL